MASVSSLLVSLRTRPRRSALACLLATLAWGVPGAGHADDTDIYRVLSTTPQLLTILSVDLNTNPSSTVCSNVLVDPSAANSGIPTSQVQACSTLRSAMTLGTYLGTLVNSGGVVSTATALAGQLDTPIGNLSSGAIAYLNSASTNIQTVTQGQTLAAVAGELAKGLVGGKLALMVNHANEGTTTTSNGTTYTCNFPDLANSSASLDPSSSTLRRQQTPYCSNGSFFLLGLNDLSNLAATVAKVTGAIGKAVVSIQGAVGTVSVPTPPTTPPDVAVATVPILPPYQGREVYAEVLHYLEGIETYNAALGYYDFAFNQTQTTGGATTRALVQVPLVRDTSIETSSSSGVTSYVSPLANAPSCDINLVHVQSTNSAQDGDSDPNLLATYDAPDLNGDGSLTYPELATAASERGFLFNSRRYKIKSTFLVQQTLSDALSLNVGNNSVFPFTDTVGLLSSTRAIAKQLNPTLVVSASMTSLARPNRLNVFAGTTPVYTALFQPAADQKPNWTGNLKRLELQFSATTNAFSVVDEAGVLAYDPNTGRLRSGLTTGFAPFVSGDGGTVTAGGAGAKIPGVATLTYNTDGTVNTRITHSPGGRNTDNLRQLFTDQVIPTVSLTSTVGLATTTTTTLGSLRMVPLNDTNNTSDDTVLNLDRVADEIGATSSCSPVLYATAYKTQRRQQALDAVLYARGFDIGTSTTPVACSALAAPTVDHHCTDGTTNCLVGRDWLMGAVLHSQPVAVNYGTASGATTPTIRVLVGSADGYLRMIDGTTGQELWAFMPAAALAQQAGLRTGAAATTLPYGVDGPVQVSYIDRSTLNGVAGQGPADGIIDTTNDSVIAYFGLRRSGNTYYALDITNPSQPILLWRIGNDGQYRFLPTGTSAGGTTAVNRSQYAAVATITPSTATGTTAVNPTAAYADMGLAFSQPSVGRLRLCSSTSTTSGSGCTLEASARTVLLIGGGYNGRVANTGTNIAKDLNNSTNTTTSPTDLRVGQNDSVGNAVYVVDAVSGDLLWRAENGPLTSTLPYNSAQLLFSHPLLNDSIVAPLNAVDTTGDGLTDRTYFGDLGGRIWRMDLSSPDRSTWTLTPLASLGRQATPKSFANDRRFTAGIDFVPTTVNGIAYDAVVFGSGDREDPRNLVTQNNLYVLFDPVTTNGRSVTDTTTYAGVITSESDPRLFKQANFAACTGTSACALNLVTSPTDTSAGHNGGWTLALPETGQAVFTQPVTTSNTILVNSYVPTQIATTACIPSEGYSVTNALFLSNGLLDTATLTLLQSGSVPRATSSANSLLAGGFAGSSTPVSATNILSSGRSGSIFLKTPSNYFTSWRERRGDEP